MMRRPRRREPPAAIAVGVSGTILVHVATVLLLWASVRTIEAAPQVYAVELVAAPAPRPEERRAPEAVSRPTPEPPAPTKPPQKTAAKPKPLPPKPTVKTPEKVEPTPRSTPRTEPLPGESGTGADVATVSTPGLAFPYPEYLRNIVQEVYRRWQRPLGNTALRAEVTFLVLRDGTVQGIRLSKGSGSFSFDLSAQGAVEAAGAARAFGPLPDGYPADVLPVSFYFTPRTQ